VQASKHGNPRPRPQRDIQKKSRLVATGLFEIAFVLCVSITLPASS
jgi:hypothetical protein